ncbi:MAG: flagellar biosynthesis protein FlhF [Pseudomonadota bacterium]
MRIERYVADDTRSAMARVRAELGGDAMILANRSVGGRVELTAAVGVEDAIANINRPRQQTESPQALLKERRASEHMQAMEAEVLRLRSLLQAERARPQEQLPVASPMIPMTPPVSEKRKGAESQLRQRLLRLGLSRSLSDELIGQVQPVKNLNESWQLALRALVERIPTATLASDRDTVFAMVGGTGVGKSSTIAKLAGADVQRFGAQGVGIITMDNYGIGAQEHMAALAYSLGIPLYPASDRKSLDVALDELRGRRVYIDTTGMGQRDDRLLRQMEIISSSTRSILPLLVLSASAQPSQSRELSSLFTTSGASGAIITKLDEATSLGGVLDVIVGSRLPLLLMSAGQRVPDDFQSADAQALVRSAVELLRSEDAPLEQRRRHPGAPATMTTANLVVQ